MKFKSTLFVAALTALSFSVVACDSGAKEEKKEEEKADGEKEEEKTEEKAEEKEEPKEEAKEEAAGDGDAPSTGIPECDELWKRTMCTIDKTPDEAAKKQAKEAFGQSAKAWQDMAANEATKQAAVDACKQALEAGKTGWDAVGC